MRCPTPYGDFSSVSGTPVLRLSAFLGKLSDIKSTWSSGPASHTQASLSHELWKVPRNTTAPTRPPPGLTNPKPSSTWGASPLGWTSSYSSGTNPSSLQVGWGWGSTGAVHLLHLPFRERACRVVPGPLHRDCCDPAPQVPGRAAEEAPQTLGACLGPALRLP